MSEETPLDRLALLAGILPGYRDALGKDHVIGADTKRALLRAMRIAVDSADDIEDSLRCLDREPWLRMADPVHVHRARRGSRCSLPVTLPETWGPSWLVWRLESEEGKVRKGRVRFGELPLDAVRDLDGAAMERRNLVLPFAVTPGRHRVSLWSEDGGETREAALSLIVAPNHCYLPPRGSDAELRLWGITAQLYGLRSSRNWGIGDFADLARLAETVGPLGSAAIGLNPLHALFPHWPAHRSPYSPSDRQFLATPYIAVELIEDFAECEEARRLVADGEFQRRLAALRNTSLVDYPAVAAAKTPVFELLYRSFRDKHLTAGRAHDLRHRAFREFQTAKGTPLRRLAIFQALSEHFAAQPWRQWPVAYRDPQSAEVADFAVAHLERVEYHEYLQWQGDCQAIMAHDRARAAGMRVGLYHDLALAPDASGAEVWANQTLFARGATLGAPPDLLNHLGQNWGLPPYVPTALRQDSYSQLSSVIRAIMARGGAMRVDHAIGLERMFWVPEGAGPADGGYVRYPVDELFGVLALESVRAESLLIGEDLGTLPEGFQARMRDAGMLSYRLLYFSQDTEGRFLKPSRYPALATVAVTTHDLATLRGYWQGRDLRMREDIHLFPSDAVRDDSFDGRTRDRRALIEALAGEGLLPPGASEDSALSPEMIEAVYRYIARTPSLLLLLGLEDVTGEVDQANLPGTIDQHPNWRRKLSVMLEDLAHDDRLRRLARAIEAERG